MGHCFVATTKTGSPTMSWFDTTKLASIANKAMKEAQKTLDSALDIAEEQVAEEENSSNLWSAWKTTKTESQPQITAEENSPQISNTVPLLGNEPVSMQPKRIVIEREVRELFNITMVNIVFPTRLQ